MLNIRSNKKINALNLEPSQALTKETKKKIALSQAPIRQDALYKVQDLVDSTIDSDIGYQEQADQEQAHPLQTRLRNKGDVTFKAFHQNVDLPPMPKARPATGADS